MNDTEAAYLAGIVDGEGHIAISKRPPNKKSGEINSSYHCYLKIGSIDPYLLSWVKDKTGLGSIYLEKRSKSAKIRPFYTWHVSSSQAESVLRKIYPFLVIKKSQAELFFSLRETIQERYNCQNGTPNDVLNLRDNICVALAAEHKRKFLPDRAFDLP